MARQVYINVDTTLNEIQVTDSDTATGDVFLDYHGKIGQPISLERADVLALTDADAMMKVTTTQGESGFFKFADIDDVQVDGVTIGAADLADVLNGVGSYFFTPVGGVPVPSASTVTFNYASGNQYKSFHRIGFACSATAATLTNVTSYTMYLNGALITPLVFPLALAQNDRLYIEIVATNTALPASIELAVTGITSAVTFASKAYYFPRTTGWLENMVQAADHFLESDQTYQGTGTNTAAASVGGVPGTDYMTDLIFETPVIGSWEMIVQQDKPINSFSYFGLGNRTTIVDNWYQRFVRMQYSWQLSQGDCRVVEGGTIRAVIAIDNPDQMLFRIKGTVVAGVGTVTYHYSNDNGATWTLAWTSARTYLVGDNTYYQQQVHRYTDATRKNYGFYTPCKMVQL